MKFLLVLAILLIASGAFACELSLVTPARSLPTNAVQADATLADDTLTVHFSVSAPSLNAKKVLAPGEYPYQFDVVELFVTFSDTGFPYFEFEVSPYNQTFQVRIISKKEHHEGVDLGLSSTATIVARGWKAELSIPLKPLGWDGDPAKIAWQSLLHSWAESWAKAETQLLEHVSAEGEEAGLSPAAVLQAAAAV